MQDDCAGDQVCSGGFCVSSPDLQCMTSHTTDAGIGGGGSATGDAGTPVTPAADAGVDAPPPATHVVITMQIDGRGYVSLDGIGACDSDPPQSGSCQFTVPVADPVTMRAFANDDWRFDRWTTSACPDEDDDRCTFLPAVSRELGAKFRKDD